MIIADRFWSVEWEPVALDVIRRIQEEAAIIADDYLGTPHLLIAAVVAMPTTRHKIAALSPESVRRAVHSLTGPSDPNLKTITPWSQTPRLKLAIEHAMRQASRESRAVRYRDIWCGLLADPESEAVAVLRHLGIHAEQIHRAIAESNASAQRGSE